MLRYKTFIVAIIFSFTSWITAQGQPAEKLIKIAVAPQNSDWIYKQGEQVKFSVMVTRNNIPMENVEIHYEIGPEKMPPVKKGSERLSNGKTIIDGASMHTAGFLRCSVSVIFEGKEYKAAATAAFDPETIEPTTSLPHDFVQFWEQAKSELSQIPIDARVTLLPERCTGKVNVYHVNLQNYKAGARLYGILSIPKAPGKYPAILKVPGAGVRAYNGDWANAERGAITFEIGIHGIPVNMDPQVYTSLANGALKGYSLFNLDNRDTYYYKRVYLGCIRAVDFIFSLPEFDGFNMVVYGQSQGGALSVVTAALDNRIKALVAFYPGLCDFTGQLYGRAGGWPHMFGSDITSEYAKQKIETSKYYDVVNFSRFVKIPGFYSWGFNDETCPPTSMYAAYNVIEAPKTLLISEETGHWAFAEQWEKAVDWLFGQFTKVAEDNE